MCKNSGTYVEGKGKDSGTYVKEKKIEDWRKLLKSWRKLNRKYCQYWLYEDELSDNPFWYTEKTQVGFLVAAAFDCNGLALQEIDICKADSKPTDRKPTDRQPTDRNDLWLKLADNDNLYYIEAKYAYAKYAYAEQGNAEQGNVLKKANSRIKTTFKNAVKEATRLLEKEISKNKKSRCKEYNIERADDARNKFIMAVCFICPQVSISDDQMKNKNDFLQEIRDDFLKTYTEEADILSWFFPKTKNSEFWIKEEGKKIIYPGMLILAKVVKP